MAQLDPRGPASPADRAGAATSGSPPHGRHRAPARRRAVLGAGRVLVALLAVIALVVTGWGYSLTQQTAEGIQARGVEALVPDDPNIVAPSVSGSGSAQDGSGSSTGAGAAENILILGLDTRPPEQASATGGTSQSDVIMIAHVSADRQRVDVVSIPRDLMVAAPTCKAWDYAADTLSDRDFENPYAEWKITNAYAVGGPQCTVRAVQALTGVRIDRLIVLQFEGFRSIVDAIGGVEITFADRVVDHGSVIIDRPGRQLVDGDQALALVRARRVAGDPTGDIGRIGRQQQVLQAMLSASVGAGVLLDPQRLNQTLQLIVENTATDNVSLENLVDLALSVRASGSGDVSFHTLPTVPDAGSEGLLLGEGAAAVFDALVNDREYPQQ